MGKLAFGEARGRGRQSEMIGHLKFVGIILAMLIPIACSAPVPSDTSKLTSSSIIIKLDIEELVNQSDWIVVGVVTEKESLWDTQHSQINTLITLAVEEWVKGEPRGNKIMFKIPGGEVGEVSQRVGNVPTFRIDEEVLVFLQSQGDDTITVVGDRQGKRVIENGNIAGSDISLAELIKQIKSQSNGSSR